MDGALTRLRHYFSAEAKAERAQNKMRVEQACKAIEPFIEQRVALGATYAYRYMLRTRGSAQAVAEEMAPEFFADLVRGARQKGQSYSEAEQEVADCILVDPEIFREKFTQGLPDLISKNAAKLEKSRSAPSPIPA